MKKEEVKNKKVRHCCYCKNEIEKDIDLCPYCNKKQSTRLIINISLIAVALALIIFLLIVSRDIFTYNVNSVVTVKNVNYAVTSVDSSYGESSWQGKPKEGNKFLIVSMSIKNNNDEEIFYNPSNWLLIVDNETIEANKYNNYDSLKEGNIDNKRVVAKVLIFEINKDTEKYILRYNNPDDLKNQFQIKLY